MKIPKLSDLLEKKATEYRKLLCAYGYMKY